MEDDLVAVVVDRAALPPWPALAPWPTAVFSESSVLRMFQETPMLLSAPPFAHELPRPGLPPKVLSTIEARAARAGAGRDEVVELADCAAADVGAQVVAHVVEEARVDDLEASTLGMDRAAAAAVDRALGNALRAAVDERDVLDHEPDARIGVAVSRSRWVRLGPVTWPCTGFGSSRRCAASPCCRRR